MEQSSKSFALINLMKSKQEAVLPMLYRIILTVFVTLLASMATPQISWASSGVLCVYDPAGRSGDYYRIMEEYVLQASSWGVNLTLKAYTDEETAAKDYQAGQCDGVVATGVRLQRFNNFPSTIEAMGAIGTYDLLKSMINSMAKYDSAAKRLRSGDHETVGFIPVGAVYLFVRDRSKNSVKDLAGLRIATMDYDKAAPVMVDRLGGIMVPADLGSIGPKFNNGDVDACYMPAPAYRPFELFRGLGTKGGIIKFPLAQGTLQVMLRVSKFPDGFTKQSRTYLAGQFDVGLAAVKRAEADIPAKYWIALDKPTMTRFDELFLDVRLRLRDDVKAYDGTMLSALRKLRCSKDSSRAECIEKKE